MASDAWRSQRALILLVCAVLLLVGAYVYLGPMTRHLAFSEEEQVLLSMLAPRELPAPPLDASNKYADNARASELGKRLFFDPGFSGRLLDGDNDGSAGTLGRRGEAQKVACASCHLPDRAFVDARSPGLSVSLAAGWGRRRAPTLLDIGQSKLLMWDGRRDSLQSQVFSVLESPVEMNSSRLFVAQQIARFYTPEYEAIFGPLPPLLDAARFSRLSAQKTGCTPRHVDPSPECDGQKHGMPGDHAEFDHLTREDQDSVTRVVVNFGKAIGAYERTLRCPPGRFDEWVHGNKSALTGRQQQGVKIFIGRGKCVSCHSGPFFSDEEFHNVGLVPQVVAAVFVDKNDRGAADGIAALLADPLNARGPFSDADDGRTPASVTPQMNGAFKTPRLRCLQGRHSFMHTGHLHDLAEVVKFFNRGGDYSNYMGVSEISPLGLSKEEMIDLVEFLKVL